MLAVMLVEKLDLLIPTFEEAAKVLQDGLSKNFKEACVEVVDCPDLSSPPFHLAAPGLCGSPRLADVGGERYLKPLTQKDKYYNLKDVPSLCNMETALVVGAGAGPWKDVGVNSELMVNLKVSGEQVENRSRVALVGSKGCCDLRSLDDKQTGNGVLSNLFLSEGKPGKVLQVQASVRKGDENFITCMRNALKEHYKDQPVGLGGCFLLEKGQAKIHIMPEFSKTPLNTDDDVKNWLRFYTMSAPMLFFSILISHDPGFDLRMEHSHGFNLHGEGGHYHYDTTPDSVVYKGYFNIAEYMYRIDQPPVPH